MKYRVGRKKKQKNLPENLLKYLDFLYKKSAFDFD